METTQNVTLAIPKSVLRKAKILAVQQNTSLSALLTQTLTELVAHQEAYEQARLRNKALLKVVLTWARRGRRAVRLLYSGNPAPKRTPPGVHPDFLAPSPPTDPSTALSLQLALEEPLGV